MNILIVKAHPSSKGLTHAIAQTYADAKTAKGHAVQIVDLYAKEYEVPLLNFENIREFQISAVQKKFQEQILWASEIVVVHPVWWSAPPSIMKNWTEIAFWPRVTYRYTGPGKTEKLLTDKTAKIFVTTGGPGWYQYLPILPLMPFWKLCVFGFSGVEVVDVKVCGRMDIMTPEKKEKQIKKFLEKIKNS